TIAASTNPLHTLRFTPFLSHTQNQIPEIDLSNKESKRSLFNQLLYRSNQQGFLELNLVLGKWVEALVHVLDMVIYSYYHELLR
ncbi:Succinate dehydrogenase assembly factor 2, mitochondrial, partial [Glycine soja]